MLCKNCGKEIPDGAKFCDGCGAKTEQISQTVNLSGFQQAIEIPPAPQPIAENAGAVTNQAPTKANSKSTFIALGIVAVIIIAVFLLFSSEGLISDDSVLSNDVASIDVAADYEYGSITFEGKLTSKTETYIGFSIYWVAYNEYDDGITSGTIVVDALQSGQSASFKETFYPGESTGDNIKYIKIEDIDAL